MLKIKLKLTVLCSFLPGCFALWFRAWRMRWWDSWWDSWRSSPLLPAILTLTEATLLGGWRSTLLGSVWRTVGWCAREFAERSMLTLTMLLKCLRLYHLTTVAADHQEEVVVCWAVAIYRHVCEWKRRRLLVMSRSCHLPS